MRNEDDANMTFHRDDDASMCRNKPGVTTNGNGDEDTMERMEEDGPRMIREENNAVVVNETNDRAINDATGNGSNDVDGMPKYEGPITIPTRMTSDPHRWEFASKNNNNNNNNHDDDGHRLASSTEFDSSKDHRNETRPDKTASFMSSLNDTKSTSIEPASSVRPPQQDIAAMDMSIVNASDAAAREEATSSMLYLSNNHNNARTTSMLLPNRVGLLHSQASPNANYPHCGTSSAMEVETMSNENGARHVKNADATGKEHNGREEAVVPAAADSCGSAEFPMQNVQREYHSSMMAPPPTLSSSSCSSVQHHHHHPRPHHCTTTTTTDADHERRGSGYLLLAAEAMERTESRENAIRRAAMELVAAAAGATGGGDGEPIDMPRFYHTLGTTTTVDASATSGRLCPYSARLQQVFEMPSLHAEQLLSSGDDPHCSSSRRRRSSCLDGRTSVTMSMPVGSRLENPEEDRVAAVVSRQEDSIRMRMREIPPRERMRGNTLTSQDGCSSNARFSSSSVAPVVSAPNVQLMSDATPSKINNNNNNGSSNSKTLNDNKSKSSKSDKNGTTTVAAATTTTSHLLPSGRPRPPPQKHVYHDYANLPDTAPILPLSHGAAAVANNNNNLNDESLPTHPSTSTIVRKKTGGVSQPFPEKLMSMLDNETRHRPEVVSWLPHGRAFLVRKPKVFTSEIMPEYFRQSKLTSFQRQLNLYGFRRITQGADGGAYYHELFLRGRPNLCARMVRQKVKGTGHKQPTDIASEPNFYAMPSVEPLPEAVASYSSTMQQQQQKQQPLIEDDDHDYDSYMNSPGIRAAALLKRMSSVGTPSQFSLDEYTNSIHPPPLVSSGAGAMDRAQSDVFRPINFGPSNLYSFDSFRSENSATFAYTPFVTVEPRTGPNDETAGTDAGINEESGSSEATAENNSFLTEV